MWSDPVAAETREVPNAAAYSFDPKLVSRQRMVKEQGAVDKEKGLWEQQSVKQPSKRHFDSRRPNEVAVNWSGSDDDGTPCPLYVEFCGDGSRLTPKREWSDVRVVRKLRGLRPQEKFAARNHFRGLRDSQQAGGRRPTPLFMRAMDNLRDGKLAEQRTRDSDIPEYLTCPLSGQVMIDPVTIATGKTFDRRFLQDWFEKKGLVCPLTGEHVSGAIVRNERIRGYLKEWNESKAEVITKVGKKRT
ncbi:U-box domain-containing protein 3 [Hordeum vulgare]|nr:U-box domain-containing protein 3 [Hordeum vulgare]